MFEFSELTKLIIIVLGGFIVFITIFTLQRRSQKRKQEALDDFDESGVQESSSLSEELPPAEQKAKNYIETYKEQYSRDSLKTALTKAGNNEASVEVWLDKYL